MSDTKASLGARIGTFMQDWGSNLLTNLGGATGKTSGEGSGGGDNVFSGLGAMVGNAITSGGGDSNVANGWSTAIQQAPDMFNAIKNFNPKKWRSYTNVAGIAGNVLGAFADERESLSGLYGLLSKNAEMVTDTVLSSIPGFGLAYTAINGVSDFLAGKYNNLSTAGSTKSDAIMDAIPLLGLANAAAGKEMNKIDYDTQAWNTVGSSYAGSQSSVKDASDNTGGRYGWLSTITGEYQKDLEQNREADRQNTLVSRISDEATEASQRSSSTIQEATMNQLKKLQGQSYTFRVKKGMKIPTKEDIHKTKKLFEVDYEAIKNFKPDYTILFKDGGKTEKKEEKPKTRSLEELIQYAKEQNPRFVLRMTEPLKTLDRGNGYYSTHSMMWDTDDKGNAYVYATVMEDKDGNLYDYKDASSLVARDRGDYLIMTPEEAELFTTNYKQGLPMFFQQTPSLKFAEGGKMNIIPEGELHARLHHMEQEGITKKGIPVISEEEGGEIVQHAEIERNEIIFRLEVTQKLEELMKDGSDNAALEAGKLLVDEILNNTEDRTGLLELVE